MSGGDALRAMARRVATQRKRRATWERFSRRVATEADAAKAELQAEVSRVTAERDRAQADLLAVKAERARVVDVAVSAGAGAAEAAVRLRVCADGRREYARGLEGHEKMRADYDVLITQAHTLDQAAEVVECGLGPMFSWLPSWRWTPEMDADLASRSRR